MAQHIAQSLLDLVGRTPLVRLSRVERALGLEAELVAKVEMLEPLRSVKDRVALAMIEAAEDADLVRPGTVIIEPTSGNTGLGLALVCAQRGYRLIIVMPDAMSIERRQLLRALGAELVLTPAHEGMGGAVRRARELADELGNAFIPSQFENLANPAVHARTTGEEIWRDAEGRVDIFVAGIGTGGTITGVGRALRAHNPQVRVVGVEPQGSAVLSGGKPGPHKLQGIGAGFVPDVLDTHAYDEIVRVASDEAFAAGRLLAEREGILAGITSGAALHAAVVVARRKENAGRRIVVLLPDTGERYLSTQLYEK